MLVLRREYKELLGFWEMPIFSKKMIEKKYKENPKHLEETIEAFIQNPKKYDQFHGTFQNGRIEGVFFSTGFMDMRRIYSFLKVEGSYDLKAGEIIFRLKRTMYYYLMSLAMLAFGIFGTIKTLESPFPSLILFPIGFALLGILIYHFVFKSRLKEFLRTFEYYHEL